MLEEAFTAIDRDLSSIEAASREPATNALDAVLEPSIALVARTMRAWIDAARPQAAVAPDADILDVWQALVKGEPTWNAIRDNCRELVYYRNCIAAGRRDALPPQASRMAVRTARHIFLYVRTRALRDGLVGRRPA